jgi:hypothetical protein
MRAFVSPGQRRFMGRQVTDPPTRRYAYPKGLGAPLTVYLRDVLTRIDEHPINAFDDLLPWNIAKPAAPQPSAFKPAKPQFLRDAYS